MIDTDEFIEAQVKGKQALLKKTRAGYSINQENPYLFYRFVKECSRCRCL